MDEFRFIDTIKQNTYQQASLVKGIGDDAAVFRASNENIVTAVDTFVEGIHFTEQTMEPYHIGYRALAANISDMAAMGADPKFYLVSIVIPDTIQERMLNELYTGMKDIAKKYKMDLIGGDTVSGSELTVSVTIIGFAPTKTSRYRSNAKENDIVFVTGTLGDSKAGLHVLLNDLEIEGKEKLIQKHQLPTPRVEFANSLQSIDRLALNDISDGIANELREVAENSNVSIVIDDDKIPVSKQLLKFSSSLQEEWKYFGGEDFELVGTASPSDWDEIKRFAKKLEVPITKIGRVIYYEAHSNERVWVKKNDKLMPLAKKGYIHEVGE